MALTFIKEPKEVTPAYNDSWYVVSSTEYANEGFYYRVSVGVNGVEKVWNIPPAPDGKLYFNARDYVINFIKREIDFNNKTDIQLITDKYIEVGLIFFEADDNLTAVNKTFYAFDGCLYNDEFDTYNVGTNWRTWQDNQIDTLFNADNRVTLNQDVWFHFTETLSISGTWTGIEVFYNNVSLGSPTYPSPYDGGFINALNIGTYLISDLGETPAIGGTVDININANIGGEDVVYKTISYTIQDICTKYPIKTLYYLRRDGQIVFKHFELVSNKSVEKINNTVRQSRSAIYNTWDREKFTTSTQTTKQIVLNSNWITESQSDALQELFDSPVVWLYENNKYIPVSITDKNYNVKTHRVDKAFNYTVTCEYDIRETRQRGI